METANDEEKKNLSSLHFSSIFLALLWWNVLEVHRMSCEPLFWSFCVVCIWCDATMTMTMFSSFSFFHFPLIARLRWFAFRFGWQHFNFRTWYFIHRWWCLGCCDSLCLSDAVSHLLRSLNLMMHQKLIITHWFFGSCSFLGWLRFSLNSVFFFLLFGSTNRFLASNIIYNECQ